MLKVKGEYIGIVKDYGALIVVSNENGIPIKNFFNWLQFNKWVDENHYIFKGNVIYKKFD